MNDVTLLKFTSSEFVDSRNCIDSVFFSFYSKRVTVSSILELQHANLIIKISSEQLLGVYGGHLC